MADDKLTSKQERFLEEYKNARCNVSKACEAVNIARCTYYAWIDKSDIFAQKRAEAEESIYDRVEDSLMNLIDDGNVTAVIFYCKTKMKKRGYIESMTIDPNEKPEPLNITFNVNEAKGNTSITKGRKKVES